MEYTKREHYVPKCYLQYFSDNEMTFCLRQGIIKQINISNLCVENDIYEFSYHVENEIQYLNRNIIENGFISVEAQYSVAIDTILREIHPGNDYIMSKKCHDDILTFSSLLVFRHNEMIKEAEAAIGFFLENPDSHFDLENFFSDHNEKLYNEITASQSEYYNNSSLEILMTASLIMAYNLDGQHLSPIIAAFKKSLGKYYFFLYSKTGSFITSDAPMVNLYDTKKDIDYDFMCLPISPNYCIVFCDDCDRHGKVYELDDKSIESVNAYHTEGGRKVIISKSKEVLEKHINLMKQKG